MENVRIGQTKSHRFDSNFPLSLQGVISKKEFINSIKILNRYKPHSNLQKVIYFFLIFIGIVLLIAGIVFFIINAAKKHDDEFFGRPTEPPNKKNNTLGIVLVSIGAPTLFVGILSACIYACTHTKFFKRKIKKELELFNEKPQFKSRNIVWSLMHTKSANKYYDYYKIIIVFPSSIQRLDDPQLLNHDYSDFYPPIQNISTTTTTTTTLTQHHQSSSIVVNDFINPQPSTFVKPTFTSPLPSEAASIQSSSSSAPSAPLQSFERNNIEMNTFDIDIDNDSSNNNNYTVKYCIKCTDHPDEILKLYCIECKIEICSDCTLTGELHYGHKYNKINNKIKY